jgi:hypothetical protein
LGDFGILWDNFVSFLGLLGTFWDTYGYLGTFGD